MSRNYYSEIHLHFVWHTKGSLPLLTEKVEPLTHHLIKSKIVETPGTYIHEVNGTETHVHAVVTLAPTILISELIGKLKGYTSHEVNKALGRKLREWQAGYGVVSFGTKDLEWVRAYVRDQKEHHAQGKTFERLERIDASEDDGAMAEAKQREAP